MRWETPRLPGYKSCRLLQASWSPFCLAHLPGLWFYTPKIWVISTHLNQPSQIWVFRVLERKKKTQHLWSPQAASFIVATGGNFTVTPVMCRTSRVIGLIFAKDLRERDSKFWSSPRWHSWEGWSTYPACHIPPGPHLQHLQVSTLQSHERKTLEKVGMKQKPSTLW